MDALEKEIYMKERYQRQIEELRSILRHSLEKSEKPVVYDKQKQGSQFKNPSLITYRCYLRKPQKIMEKFISLRRGHLVIEQDGVTSQMHNLSELKFVELGRKYRLHLVFSYGDLYIQLQTQRKQLKYFEALSAMLGAE